MSSHSNAQQIEQELSSVKKPDAMITLDYQPESTTYLSATESYWLSEPTNSQCYTHSSSTPSPAVDMIGVPDGSAQFEHSEQGEFFDFVDTDVLPSHKTPIAEAGSIYTIFEQP